LELAHYESYIHRQLPRLVRQSIEEAVRRDVRPTEASLIKSLVSVIHDCQDRIFQAYIEMADREDSIRALGIRSKDPFRSSTLSKDTEHQHSLLLDAAFQQPPSQEMGSNRPSLRSSLLSSSPHSASVTPITPSEMDFSGSSASDITSSCSTPSQVGSDLNKYSLLRDMRDEHLRSVNKLNLFEYDELDEALAWSQVY
jgi:hypothetical protein